MALRRVRRLHRGRLDSVHDLERFESLDLDDLDREWLFEQAVVVSIAEGVDKFFQTLRAEDA